MRTVTFLAAFAIILASAFAAPRRGPDDPISKEDFDYAIDLLLVGWAEGQLAHHYHFQRIEALLTSSGHGELWGCLQNVITKANDAANVVFDETIKAAEPNMITDALVELLVDGLGGGRDLLSEAVSIVTGIIKLEAEDVVPQSREIIGDLWDQNNLAFEPLFQFLFAISLPTY